MEKFFLMTQGRTGSTAVVDELNKCDGFHVEQELLLDFDFSSDYEGLKMNPDVILPFSEWKKRLQRKWFLSEKAIISRYFKAIEQEKAGSATDVFGFKILSNNFPENKFLAENLKKYSYKAIYLTRNLSRQVLSGMIARQRNIYNSRKEFDDSECYKIDLEEFSSLVSWIKNSIELDKELLDEYGFDFIDVSYEEFVHNRALFYSNIFDFLKVSNRVPPSSDYIIMIKDIRHTIKNYGEIEKLAKMIGIPLEGVAAN